MDLDHRVRARGRSIDHNASEMVNGRQLNNVTSGVERSSIPAEVSGSWKNSAVYRYIS